MFWITAYRMRNPFGFVLEVYQNLTEAVNRIVEPFADAAQQFARIQLRAQRHAAGLWTRAATRSCSHRQQQ